MLQNSPNCTIQNFFPEIMHPNPPSKRLATPRVASTQKSWPPLANPAYAHVLLLKNLFEEVHSIESTLVDS